MYFVVGCFVFHLSKRTLIIGNFVTADSVSLALDRPRQKAIDLLWLLQVLLSAIESTQKPRSSYLPIMSENRVVMAVEILVLWNMSLIGMMLFLDVRMFSGCASCWHGSFMNADSMLLSRVPLIKFKMSARTDCSLHSFTFRLVCFSSWYPLWRTTERCPKYNILSWWLVVDAFHKVTAFDFLVCFPSRFSICLWLWSCLSSPPLLDIIITFIHNCA